MGCPISTVCVYDFLIPGQNRSSYETSLLSGRTRQWVSSHGAASPPSPLPLPLLSHPSVPGLPQWRPPHPPAWCSSSFDPAAAALRCGVEPAHSSVSLTLQHPPGPERLRHRGEPRAALPGTGDPRGWSTVAPLYWPQSVIQFEVFSISMCLPLL